MSIFLSENDLFLLPCNTAAGGDQKQLDTAMWHPELSRLPGVTDAFLKHSLRYCEEAVSDRQTAHHGPFFPPQPLRARWLQLQLTACPGLRGFPPCAAGPPSKSPPHRLLRHVVAYKVLALLHGQLLPLPKGVNVSVVKNICASNKTSRKPSCDAGPCGKAGLPISVLLALWSLLLKMCHSYLSSLPHTKRSPATFSLVFHSIVPVLSFTCFQVCCIYC